MAPAPASKDTQRTVTDGLLVYDRIVEAGVEDIILQARQDLGPKNALDVFSKLVAISQRAYATARAADGGKEASEMLAASVRGLFIRMKVGAISTRIPYTSLCKTHLPCLWLMELMRQYIMAAFAYDLGTRDHTILSRFSAPATFLATLLGNKPVPLDVRQKARASAVQLPEFVLKLWGGGLRPCADRRAAPEPETGLQQ